MKYRVLTQYTDIPEYYFPWPEPLVYRGKIDRSKLCEKTLDPSEIPEFICIQIEGRKGDSPRDWETVRVDLAITLEEPPLPLIEDPVIEKKRRLLGLRAANFHYLEESIINNLYDDFFAAPLPNPFPVIEEVTVEIQKAIQGNAQENIEDIVKAALSREKLERIFTQIKFVQLAASTKFIQYQKRMIEEGQVILDLELTDKQSVDLAAFDRLIRQMHSYGLQVDSEQIIDKRKRLAQGTINEILESMEKTVNQQVIITANFNVSDDGDNYRLSYEHPINKLIDQKIEIWVTVSKVKILGNWGTVYSQSYGQTVRANVYGTVFPTKKHNEGDWEVAINPIAIYA